MFEQKEQFETWFQDNYFRLDTPSQFLGDEMNTVHFDWKKAYEEGTLEDHFRIALIDVNGTSYASCSPAVKLFYQELHEYDDSWIVERVFAPATKGDEAILKENEEDWEELVKLTAKMGDICREEGRTGRSVGNELPDSLPRGNGRDKTSENHRYHYGERYLELYCGVLPRRAFLAERNGHACRNSAAVYQRA